MTAATVAEAHAIAVRVASATLYVDRSGVLQRYPIGTTGAELFEREGRSVVSAYLASLEAAGFVVVPVKATEEMVDAAHSALYRWREAQGDPQQDPTNPQKHAIRYAAMIAARPRLP